MQTDDVGMLGEQIETTHRIRVLVEVGVGLIENDVDITGDPRKEVDNLIGMQDGTSGIVGAAQHNHVCTLGNCRCHGRKVMGELSGERNGNGRGTCSLDDRGECLEGSPRQDDLRTGVHEHVDQIGQHVDGPSTHTDLVGIHPATYGDGGTQIERGHTGVPVDSRKLLADDRRHRRQRRVRTLIVGSLDDPVPAMMVGRH